jgi:hypothetical protein
MDPVAESLLTAQRKAEALFATVVELGMIRPGLTESELSLHIHELASAEFGLRRGRTYALGADPHKHRLIADIGCAFRQGQRLYQDTPDLSAGALYDFVAGLAQSKGWEFGAATAARRATGSSRSTSSIARGRSAGSTSSCSPSTESA